jgi:glycerol-3-phosphate dehydrogenase (NAD(P)+)
MKIQVMGSGGWGIALARLLLKNGHSVSLWGRNPHKIHRLAYDREDRGLLPGVLIPAEIAIVEKPELNCDMIVYAVPSHAMKETVEKFSFRREAIRVSTAKGIETDTLLRMSERIALAAPESPVAVISGPSHAEEVGRDLPTCAVVAGTDVSVCRSVQESFGSATFRVYTSTDIIGVELGGALKNIIAIAAGACEGFGLGDNAKAALITRGLAEMVRLGVACGAEASTFSGLSGLGDLVVTCASRHSRNHRVGMRIAQGLTLSEILLETSQVAEGIRASKSVHRLAGIHEIEMPIANAVYSTLFEGLVARIAITALMTRLMKAEWE